MAATMPTLAGLRPLTAPSLRRAVPAMSLHKRDHVIPMRAPAVPAGLARPARVALPRPALRPAGLVQASAAGGAPAAEPQGEWV